MPATYGYGKKTFVQALARLCKHTAIYLVKHDAKLKLYLPPAAYTCITGTIPCLNSIAALLNQSAT
jgi:hypothetical protein